MIQIRVGKQKKKEKKKIYTENKIGRYVQFLIEREDFLELVASWLLSIEDERMQLLRQFIFEVELSETEELKNVLYQYGSYLTEKNYLERKFFEYMAELVRKMEQNRRAAALPAAIEERGILPEFVQKETVVLSSLFFSVQEVLDIVKKVSKRK